MDFWDHSSWKRIPQNDPSADVPEVNTPRLIKHVNPDVKLILILRDPIERLVKLSYKLQTHHQFKNSQHVKAVYSALESAKI